MFKLDGKTIEELYRESTCEVSKSVLRIRLMAGEPWGKAKKLRNFVCCGKKYRNLWELSKETLPLLTYQQLAYRICVLKLSPEKAVWDTRQSCDIKRATGKAAHRQRGTKSGRCALSRMNPKS